MKVKNTKLEKELAHIEFTEENFTPNEASSDCFISCEHEERKESSDTKYENKYDVTDPFSTYCYWNIDPSSIDDKDSGFKIEKKYYPYDQTLTVLIGTAERCPERFKQPNKVKKISNLKTEEKTENGLNNRRKYKGKLSKNLKFTVSKFKKLFS